MRLLLNLLPVLFLLGAAQGVFLALVLAGMKRGNRVANRFLIFLLLLFSIDLVSGFLSITYAYRQYPGLIGVASPLVFLYGPLVYFYVKTLTEPQRQVRQWKLFAHVIPVILLYIYLIPVFQLDPVTKGEAWFFENSHLRNYSPIVDPILYVVIFQIAGYLILALRLLKVHSKNIRQTFSSLEGINLNWLRYLIMVFFCLLLMYVFHTVFSQFYGAYKKSEFILYLMIAGVIYVMGYKGIRQPEIFTSLETSAAPESSVSNNHNNKLEATPETPQSAGEAGQTEKYKKSALTSEQSDTILAQLTCCMEKDKPYLEMGLTLPMIAKMLDISQHHLSQVINEKLGKSFFDFINEYRVQETKKALFSSKAERFSILGIAMDAGFNSKSAFYTAFKKHTGMTPSQFKEHTASQNHSKVQNPQ
jgi:AraC-like DNA-binding protein